MSVGGAAEAARRTATTCRVEPEVEVTTPLTLGAAVQRYLQARRYELRPESLRTIRGELQRFAIETGWDRPLSRVGRRHVEAWMQAHHGSPSGDRKRLSALRTFFRWHLERRNIRTDPTMGVGHAPVPRYLPRGVGPEVPPALLSVCDARGRLIVLLTLQEMLRRSEVAGLQLGDIDFNRRELVVTGKGGHQRALPLSEETWSAIGDYLGQYPAAAGPLIRSYSHPHDGITASHVTYLFRQWRAEAGVYATPHRMRHTGAADVLRNGAHVRDLQQGLGHADLASTQRYMPLVVHGLREAMGSRWYGPAQVAVDDADKAVRSPPAEAAPGPGGDRTRSTMPRSARRLVDSTPPNGRYAPNGQAAEINGNGGPPRLPNAGSCDMNPQTCPRCGLLAGDRGLHGQWHDDLDRELASLRDALPKVEVNSQRIAELEHAVSR